MFDNKEKEKLAWKKKERRLKLSIIGIILAFVLLIIIIVFFKDLIWAIITNIGIILGLFVNIITLVKSTKGGR